LTPLTHRLFRHSVEVDLDEIVARVASISFIASLPPPEGAVVLHRVCAVAAAQPDVAQRARVVLPSSS
jgi:hypothetical protein